MMEDVKFEKKKGKVLFIKENKKNKNEENEVIVEVVYDGICGNEMKIDEGKLNCSDNKVIIGNELSGVVEDVG